MRVQSPEIGWHGPKDRILSIDFHHFSNEFVSAGSDELKFVEEEKEGTQGCVKVWQIINDGQPIHPDRKNIRILYGLFEADKNTNVVRYSPNGGLLASGSDDKCITIWEKRQNCISINRSGRMLRWSIKGRMSGHTEDVLDLKWTHDSRFIVSAGMDKRILIWNVDKKYHIKVLDEHQKFVQGIAIDLRFQHIISCSNDRSVKIWTTLKTKKSETEFYCKKSLRRYDYLRNENEDLPDQKAGFRIFADESVPTFFRRPDFSPDGQLFLLPAGLWQKDTESKLDYCALLYRKNFLDRPSYVIPTNGQPALICKFCPKLFVKNKQRSLFQQNYYMVYAIATTSAVLIFSTEQLQPIFGMGSYHYAALTDLSWRGSQMLAISSSDGYCSFMMFDNSILGQIYQPTGDLATAMKITEYQPPQSQKSVPPESQQQRVQYRELENGVKKKKIIPRKIAEL